MAGTRPPHRLNGAANARRAANETGSGAMPQVVQALALAIRSVIDHPYYGNGSHHAKRPTSAIPETVVGPVVYSCACQPPAGSAHARGLGQGRRGVGVLMGICRAASCRGATQSSLARARQL
jgi:hypothetical protein